MIPDFLKQEKTPDAGELYGVLAQFDSPGDLINAAKEVRDAGYQKWDCYSPFPVHGIDPAMGIKMTILPWIVFGAGMSGLLGGLLLQWWTNAHFWPWLVSGKPFWSLPANIPVAFETTILGSVFGAFFGMWILNGLPQVWHPFFRNKKFLTTTDDGFFVGIEAADERFDGSATAELLKGLGALSIEEVHIDADPEKKKMPVGIYGLILVSTVLALVPIALVMNARASKSRKPHYHVIPDMDFQTKVKPQRVHKLLGQNNADRIDIPGTVSRDSIQEGKSEALVDGTDGGQWAKTFPAEITVDQAFMDKGQRRYETFCRPCHGSDGEGNGVVAFTAGKLGPAVKGWSTPKNLVATDYINRAPHGQLFNIITYGTSNQAMQGYGSQISPEDRWAIVAYLRALQLSKNAVKGDFN